MSTTGSSGISTCVGFPGGQPGFVGISAPTAAQVERTGDSITVRPDDPAATFRMDLQISGATVSGTASGQYRSAATVIAVGGSSGAAVVTGILGPSFMSGALTGSVSVESLTCSNNGHSWSLAPR
jgi:hypothetical protein